MTTTTKPPVPPMTINVTGQTYGGAYWNQTEFEFTFTVVHQELWRPGDKFTAELLDTSGNHVWSVQLSRTSAEHLHGALTVNARDVNLYPALTGLVRTTIWSLGDNENEAILDGGRLAEVAAWLKYALGYDTWDYAVNGDEWEY